MGMQLSGFLASILGELLEVFTLGFWWRVYSGNEDSNEPKIAQNEEKLRCFVAFDHTGMHVRRELNLAACGFVFSH